MIFTITAALGASGVPEQCSAVITTEMPQIGTAPPTASIIGVHEIDAGMSMDLDVPAGQFLILTPFRVGA